MDAIDRHARVGVAGHEAPVADRSADVHLGAGIRLRRSRRRQYGGTVIAPTSTVLGGPHDPFDLESAHLRPAPMGVFPESRPAGGSAVDVWGCGVIHPDSVIRFDPTGPDGIPRARGIDPLATV